MDFLPGHVVTLEQYLRAHPSQKLTHSVHDSSLTRGVLSLDRASHWAPSTTIEVARWSSHVVAGQVSGNEADPNGHQPTRT